MYSLHRLFVPVSLAVIAFAGDVKFVADVTTLTVAEVQSDINIIALWAVENYTPLSSDKCDVLHCGKQQHPNNNHINGAKMKSVDSFPDLGVKRTTVLNSSGHYRRHYELIAFTAAKIVRLHKAYLPTPF